MEDFFFSTTVASTSSEMHENPESEVARSHALSFTKSPAFTFLIQLFLQFMSPSVLIFNSVLIL